MSEHGTNGIPRTLEDKLVEAKEWCDSCPDAAVTDDLVREQWSAQAALILLDIVEAVDATWGYGPRAESA